MIRDRLVCGIKDDALQKHLSAEPDLTYEKALLAVMRQPPWNLQNEVASTDVCLVAGSGL